MYLLAFGAKNGQNTVKSDLGAVDRLLRGPMICFQRPKTAENAGVLLLVLSSQRTDKKVKGEDSNPKQIIEVEEKRQSSRSFSAFKTAPVTAFIS